MSAEIGAELSLRSQGWRFIWQQGWLSLGNRRLVRIGFARRTLFHFSWFWNGGILCHEIASGLRGDFAGGCTSTGGYKKDRRDEPFLVWLENVGYFHICLLKFNGNSIDFLLTCNLT